MAVAFDTAGSAESGANPGPSSLTTSLTVVGAGSADFMVGQGATMNGITLRTIDSQTYATVSMTGVGAISSTADFVKIAAKQFWLAAPATGANNLVTTFSGTCNNCKHGFQSFSGAHQTVQDGTAVTGSGSNDVAPSVTVTSATGEIVVGLIATINTLAANLASGDTESWERGAAFQENGVANASRQDGAASVVMDWTQSANIDWAITAWPVKPAAAGGAGSRRPGSIFYNMIRRPGRIV